MKPTDNLHAALRKIEDIKKGQKGSVVEDLDEVSEEKGRRKDTFYVCVYVFLRCLCLILVSGVGVWKEVLLWEKEVDVM